MCKPPEESCNGVDDDCDGLVDPDLLGEVAGRRVWTGMGTVADSAVPLWLLNRADGGAWLVTRLQRSDTEYDWQAQQLDTNGGAVGSSKLISSLTTLGARSSFSMASDGKWIAVLKLGLNTVNNYNFSLSLFRTSDFGLVAEHDIPGLREGPVLCWFAHPLSVGVAEDDRDNLSVVLTFGQIDGPTPDSSALCPTAITKLDVSVQLSSFNLLSGVWSDQTIHTQAGESTVSAIARSACNGDWLVALSGAGSTLLRFAPDGTRLRSTRSMLDDVTTMRSFAVLPTSCDEGREDVLVTYVPATGTSIRHWSTTGGTWGPASHTRLTDEDMVDVKMIVRGGRVFAAGIPDSGQPRLFELDYEGKHPRAVPVVPAESGASSSLRLSAVYLFGMRLLDLVDAGGVLLLGMSRNTPSTTLAALREPGDSNPPLVVTYPIGCTP